MDCRPEGQSSLISLGLLLTIVVPTRPDLWATVHRFFEDRIAKDLAPPSTTLEYFETMPAGCAPADSTVPAPRLQTRVPRNPRTRDADLLLLAATLTADALPPDAPSAMARSLDQTSNELWNFMQGHRVSVAFGTSGAGKTAAMYATLVKRGGIYISFQAEEVLRDTHSATRYLRLQGQAKLARTPEEAERLAQHGFARILIVYAAVVKYFGLRGFSHLDLLLLQLYPDRYLPVSLFDQVSGRAAARYSLESCVVFLDTLLPLGTPVMIDEAHLLCEEGLLAYPSGHAGTTHTTNSPPRKDGVSIASPRPDHPPLLRPAVAPLLRVLNSLLAFSVLAGTGVRLTSWMDDTKVWRPSFDLPPTRESSALLKQGDLPVFCNFGSHSTEAEVRQFLLDIVPDPAYWGAEIPKRFIGRHRFAASLVKTLLSKAWPLAEAADSAANEACDQLEGSIARLLMEPPIGSLSLGVIFEKMMVQYCLLGMQVLIGEPMVFVAYCNYLKACHHSKAEVLLRYMVEPVCPQQIGHIFEEVLVSGIEPFLLHPKVQELTAGPDLVVRLQSESDPAARGFLFYKRNVMPS
ncbi:hypothetical protein PAPYR_12668 [Paratrimastix pyriformis]|uniref:Uncharacterized protein n=1 Tax=Paratrimastix pyriformis TaxID=342808 RepID=A0ABQ8U1H8_9EUKA|nr:hypothetical protein PAPYR_12668 [Paratrimastix pyriformis]